MEPAPTYTTAERNPSLKIGKAELATNIRKYITHSRFIILNSKNNLYRNMRTLANLELCEQHAKMLKDFELVSMKDICQFTLMLRKPLEGILPSLNNDSYQSSKNKLDIIIDQCMHYLKNTQTNAA